MIELIRCLHSKTRAAIATVLYFIMQHTFKVFCSFCLESPDNYVVVSQKYQYEQKNGAKSYFRLFLKNILVSIQDPPSTEFLEIPKKPMSGKDTSLHVVLTCMLVLKFFLCSCWSDEM